MSKMEEAPFSSNYKRRYFLEALYILVHHITHKHPKSWACQASPQNSFGSEVEIVTEPRTVTPRFQNWFSPKRNVKAPLEYRIGVDMIVTYENASLAVVALKNGYSVWLLHGTRRVRSVRRVLSTYRRRRAPLEVDLHNDTASSFASLQPDISPHGEWLLRGNEQISTVLADYEVLTREPNSNRTVDNTNMDDIMKTANHIGNHTCSPAFGPSVQKRIGRQRLSSFIKLEFWKWATRADFPWIRAYARAATFSLLNFSHFLPLNACRRNEMYSFCYYVQQGNTDSMGRATPQLHWE